MIQIHCLRHYFTQGTTVFRSLERQSIEHKTIEHITCSSSMPQPCTLAPKAIPPTIARVVRLFTTPLSSESSDLQQLANLKKSPL